MADAGPDLLQQRYMKGSRKKQNGGSQRSFTPVHIPVFIADGSKYPRDIIAKNGSSTPKGQTIEVLFVAKIRNDAGGSHQRVDLRRNDTEMEEQNIQLMVETCPLFEM